MKNIHPGINTRELIKDMLAADLEEKGIHTGRFTRSVYPIPPTPKETKQVRKASGLSQSKFAEAMGVSPKTVQSWEHGSRKPDGAATKLLRLLRGNPKLVHALEKI